MTDQPQHQTDQNEAQNTAPVTQAAPFTEAPYSGNVRARIAGYDWQLTIRAADAPTFLGKINGLMKWLNDNSDRAVNVEAPKAPATGAPVPPPPPTTVAAPAQPASGVMTLKIVKMQVSPRADGKIDLKFFEAGHNYADIYTSKSISDAVKLLQATGKWEPHHFAKADEFNVNFVIDYKNSTKLNSKGNPYKDILSVNPAA